MGKLNIKKKLKVLRFTLENAQLCIDIKGIDKVIQLPWLKPVPESPSYLVGLLNMEGVSIPVIDLTLRLGLEREQPYHLDAIILLCSNERRKIGMIVDKVIGLSDVGEEQLQMKSDFHQPSSPFIAVAAIKEELSLLLDIEKIINNDVVFDTALFGVSEIVHEKRSTT